MQISHVIRAEEWISSTPKHILLYKAFGWKMPKFAHTPLLRNPDRSKLSKRRNPVSVIWYKKKGFLPEALINYLCLMGWSHPRGKEKFSIDEFIRLISLKRIQTSQPVFDLEKLRWLNGLYIREKSDKQLLQLLKPFLPKNADLAIVRKIIPLIKERIHTLSEFSDYAQFFFSLPPVESELLLRQSRHSREETRKKLQEFSKMLKAIPKANFNLPNLENKARRQLTDNWSPRQLFMTIRAALTGKTVSPPLFQSIIVLGKKQTVSRLERACAAL
jgi:glutamyl-tRNA synthetase